MAIGGKKWGKVGKKWITHGTQTDHLVQRLKPNGPYVYR